VTARPGLSLVELIVAMTLLSVGVLGLAGAAAVAQRSFAGAEALERAAHAAAVVLDSLMREPRPYDGERSVHDSTVRWTVVADSLLSRIDLTVTVFDGARAHDVTYHAVHSALLLR
jgi:prepilin-type N-terminal cleavage/methylation domain-containing protein